MEKNAAGRGTGGSIYCSGLRGGSLWAVALLMLTAPAAGHDGGRPVSRIGQQKEAIGSSMPAQDRADEAEEFIAIFADGIGGPGVGDTGANGPSKVATAIAQSKKLEDAVEQVGGRVRHRYRAALIGFAARLTPGQLHDLKIGFLDPSLPFLPSRRRVFPDKPSARGFVGDRKVGWTTHRSSAPTRAQFELPAGLDRIDQRLGPLDRMFRYSQDGAGVHIYVIDSGIRASHIELNGRVLNSPGEEFVGPEDNKGTDDCHGHGSLVAGIIGASNLGVAKKALMHPVRVFDCEGETTDGTVLAAVDWVTGHYLRAGRAFPAVANMSFGHLMEGKTDWLNVAVQNSISTGITYVAAAGNARKDACIYAPGRVDQVILVGNIDPFYDRMVGSSNFGSCVDIFAPGSEILSVGIRDDYAVELAFGTSMAAPHVAGVAALFLQGNPKSSPEQVWKAILNSATKPGCRTWKGIPELPLPGNDRLLYWAPEGMADSC